MTSHNLDDHHQLHQNHTHHHHHLGASPDDDNMMTTTYSPIIREKTEAIDFHSPDDILPSAGGDEASSFDGNHSSSRRRHHNNNTEEEEDTSSFLLRRNDMSCSTSDRTHSVHNHPNHSSQLQQEEDRSSLLLLNQTALSSEGCTQHNRSAHRHQPSCENDESLWRVHSQMLFEPSPSSAHCEAAASGLFPSCPSFMNNTRTNSSAHSSDRARRQAQGDVNQQKHHQPIGMESQLDDGCPVDPDSVSPNRPFQSDVSPLDSSPEPIIQQPTFDSPTDRDAPKTNNFYVPSPAKPSHHHHHHHHRPAVSPRRRAGGLFQSSGDDDDDDNFLRVADPSANRHPSTAAAGTGNSTSHAEGSYDPYETLNSTFEEHDDVDDEQQHGRVSFLEADDGDEGEDSGLHIDRLYEAFEDFVELGQGDFGTVSSARCVADGMHYAIKATRKPVGGEVEKQNKLQEVYALSCCPTTRHLLRYYDSWLDHAGKLHIQTELLRGGSVAKFHQKPWPERLLWSFLQQTALGLHTMHCSNVAHLDIKPDNIFFSTLDDESDRESSSATVGDDACQLEVGDSKVLFTIGDFGLARPVAHVEGFVGLNDDEGDCRYICPVLISTGRTAFVMEADIYSLGATLVDLAGGDPNQLRLTNDYSFLSGAPQPQRDHAANVGASSPSAAGPSRTHEGYSAMFVSVVRAMTDPMPQRRPSAFDVLRCATATLNPSQPSEGMPASASMESNLIVVNNEDGSPALTHPRTVPVSGKEIMQSLDDELEALVAELRDLSAP